MSGSRPPRTGELAAAVVQRDTSLFAADVAEHHEAVAARVRGRRVLVVGGAGSIGSSTVGQLASFAPRQLHVVDVDENGLTELVRDLRNRDLIDPATELRTTPLDAASPTMARLLRDNAGYDHVLNFAAVKHVRSEKDVYSLLRMIEVNLRLPRRLLGWLGPDTERYFAVSTDKAADPVNLMGASKRAMEHLILDEDLGPQVSSARFANVAFSQGSLLDGWLRRLEKGQAWAVPEGTRRYFVTPVESGQLCLLAATLGPAGHVLIPGLRPERHLRMLTAVATDVLAAMDLAPLWCTEEGEARRAAVRPPSGRWPVLLTSLDTAGEKEAEEFLSASETAVDCGFSQLRAVRPVRAAPTVIASVLADADQWLDDAESPVDEDAVLTMLRRLVPELDHRASRLGLDSRM